MASGVGQINLTSKQAGIIVVLAIAAVTFGMYETSPHDSVTPAAHHAGASSSKHQASVDWTAVAKKYHLNKIQLLALEDCEATDNDQNFLNLTPSHQEQEVESVLEQLKEPMPYAKYIKDYTPYTSAITPQQWNLADDGVSLQKAEEICGPFAFGGRDEQGNRLYYHFGSADTSTFGPVFCLTVDSNGAVIGSSGPPAIAQEIIKLQH